MLLFLAVSDLIEKPDPAEQHLAGIDRYASAYRTLQSRTDVLRVNFAGGLRSEGERWMSESDAAELVLLPKPEEVPVLVKEIKQARWAERVGGARSRREAREGR
jgi:hypothetical protein